MQVRPARCLNSYTLAVRAHDWGVKILVIGASDSDGSNLPDPSRVGKQLLNFVLSQLPARSMTAWGRAASSRARGKIARAAATRAWVQ